MSQKCQIRMVSDPPAKTVARQAEVVLTRHGRDCSARSSSALAASAVAKPRPAVYKALCKTGHHARSEAAAAGGHRGARAAELSPSGCNERTYRRTDRLGEADR